MEVVAALLDSRAGKVGATSVTSGVSAEGAEAAKSSARRSTGEEDRRLTWGDITVLDDRRGSHPARDPLVSHRAGSSSYRDAAVLNRAKSDTTLGFSVVRDFEVDRLRSELGVGLHRSDRRRRGRDARDERRRVGDWSKNSQVIFRTKLKTRTHGIRRYELEAGMRKRFFFFDGEAAGVATFFFASLDEGAMLGLKDAGVGFDVWVATE